MTIPPNRENLNTPATNQFVRDEVQQVRQDLSLEITKLHAKIDKSVEELHRDLSDTKNEILTSNDHIAQKLNRFLGEQTAIHLNYERLDRDVSKLKTFAKTVASKLGIFFG